MAGRRVGGRMGERTGMHGPRGTLDQRGGQAGL